MFRAIFTAAKISFVEVPPKEWQKKFGIKGIKGDPDATKEQSYLIASRLFPLQDFKTERGRTLDGRSDAALITEFGRAMELGNGEIARRALRSNSSGERNSSWTRMITTGCPTRTSGASTPLTAGPLSEDREARKVPSSTYPLFYSTTIDGDNASFSRTETVSTTENRICRFHFARETRGRKTAMYFAKEETPHRLRSA